MDWYGLNIYGITGIELLHISDDVLLGTAKYKGLSNTDTVYKNAVIWISILNNFVSVLKIPQILEGHSIIYVGPLRKSKNFRRSYIVYS